MTTSIQTADTTLIPALRHDSTWGAYVQEVLAQSRRWFIHIQRERLNLFFSIAQPALWLIFFGGMFQRAIDPAVIDAPDYTTFMLSGIIVFTVVGNAVSGAMPLMWDKENGFLAKMLTAPISRSSIVVSRFVFMMCLSTIQAVCIVLVGLALGVEFAAGVAGVFVILLLTGLVGMSLTAAFLALAFITRNHGDFFAITGFITLPLFFMSSAFAPLSAMPDWMQVVARLNPLTYGINAMRHLVIDGWTDSLPGDLLILFAFASGCLAVATWAFQRHPV
jgi:ABC-2 type transport system permease protein